MTDDNNKNSSRNTKSAAESGILGRLVTRGALLFSLAIVASMVILIQEVILRYVFTAPTVWAHETTVFLCSIAFIFGGLYCAAKDSHIRVVLIYDNAGPRLRRTLDIIIALLSSVSAMFFAWASWLTVERAIFRPNGDIHFETTGSVWDPPFPAWTKLFLFAVMAILAVQFLFVAWHHVRRPAPDAGDRS